MNIAFTQDEGTRSFPAFLVLDKDGSILESLQVRTDDPSTNDLKVQGLKCSGSQRYMVGTGSNTFVSHASGD